MRLAQTNTSKSNQQLISEGIDSHLSPSDPAESAARYRRLADELKAELQWLVFVEDRSKFEAVKAAIFVIDELAAEAGRFLGVQA